MILRTITIWQRKKKNINIVKILISFFFVNLVLVSIMDELENDRLYLKFSSFSFVSVFKRVKLSHFF
jgi:hypothetical protein